MARRRAVFDRHVLAWDEADFAEALLDGRELSGVDTAEQTDHGHRRLLRARREWPSCRTAKRGNKS
jgi:hypothetical protein